MDALKSLGLVIMLLASASARADWTWNVGYQNPAVSTFGFNLFYMGNPWGFEVGLGWIDVSSHKNDDSGDEIQPKEGDDGDDKSSAGIHLAGDADVKYMLSSGKFRPYVQGGFGLGIGAESDRGAAASAGAASPGSASSPARRRSMPMPRTI